MVIDIEQHPQVELYRRACDDPKLVVEYKMPSSRLWFVVPRRSDGKPLAAYWRSPNVVMRLADGQEA